MAREITELPPVIATLVAEYAYDELAPQSFDTFFALRGDHIAVEEDIRKEWLEMELVNQKKRVQRAKERREARISIQIDGLKKVLPWGCKIKKYQYNVTGSGGTLELSVSDLRGMYRWLKYATIQVLPVYHHMFIHIQQQTTFSHTASQRRSGYLHVPTPEAFGVGKGDSQQDQRPVRYVYALRAHASLSSLLISILYYNYNLYNDLAVVATLHSAQQPLCRYCRASVWFSVRA